MRGGNESEINIHLIRAAFRHRKPNRTILGAIGQAILIGARVVSVVVRRFFGALVNKPYDVLSDNGPCPFLGLQLKREVAVRVCMTKRSRAGPGITLCPPRLRRDHDLLDRLTAECDTPTHGYEVVLGSTTDQKPTSESQAGSPPV